MMSESMACYHTNATTSQSWKRFQVEGEKWRQPFPPKLKNVPQKLGDVPQKLNYFPQRPSKVLRDVPHFSVHPKKLLFT
jgi:hypothetical protein